MRGGLLSFALLENILSILDGFESHMFSMLTRSHKYLRLRRRLGTRLLDDRLDAFVVGCVNSVMHVEAGPNPFLEYSPQSDANFPKSAAEKAQAFSKKIAGYKEPGMKQHDGPSICDIVV
ncbi:hypothetical protein F5Y10DRAFT_233916 [Nemania abortiva]|nr:hypothetical protein F5Y10DRAFT_233916 [Nemania abortiva]